MKERDRDPIHTVKTYLSSATAESRGSRASAIDQDLLEIKDRLARAREVEARIALSDAIQALLTGGGQRTDITNHQAQG